MKIKTGASWHVGSAGSSKPESKRCSKIVYSDELKMIDDKKKFFKVNNKN